MQGPQETAAGVGSPSCVLVRHDDAAREQAFDQGFGAGSLREVLDEASASGWTGASMDRDWARVFSKQGARTAP